MLLSFVDILSILSSISLTKGREARAIMVTRLTVRIGRTSNDKNCAIVYRQHEHLFISRAAHSSGVASRSGSDRRTLQGLIGTIQASVTWRRLWPGVNVVLFGVILSGTGSLRGLGVGFRLSAEPCLIDTIEKCSRLLWVILVFCLQHLYQYAVQSVFSLYCWGATGSRRASRVYFESNDCADPSGFASCYEEVDSAWTDCINNN
jgi:hypothetical protein